MIITRIHNGAWEVSDIKHGYLMRRVYYGYTKREARRLFRAEVRDGDIHDGNTVKVKIRDSSRPK